MSSPIRRPNFIQPIRRATAQTVMIAGKVWRNIDIRKPESWLSTLVNLLLRIGTLILIFALVALVWRIFKNEGFTIEPFNMPKNWQDNGYTGDVAARQLLDVYQFVKKKGYSVKDDQVVAEGPDNAELNVSVMGFGVSLRSIAFHLRELMGRPNQLVRGEVMEIDSSLVLCLRMSGHEAQTFKEKISNSRATTLEHLMLQAGEAVLGNTDPYRLSLYYTRDRAFEKARNVLLNMMKTSPKEKHWALFGLAVYAESVGDNPGAIHYLKQALAFKPDFSFCYQRMMHLYNDMNNLKEAEVYGRRALAANPSDSIMWNSMGYALFGAKKYPASDSAFAQVMKLTHHNPFWTLNWIECLAKRGETERASTLALQCLPFCRDSGSWYFMQGYVADMKYNRAVASDNYLKAVRLDPSNLLYLQNAINYEYQANHYKSVIAMGANPHLEGEDDNLRAQTIWNYVAMSYNYSGNTDSALYWINKSVAVNPDIGYPYSTLAEIYGMKGDRESFYKYLEEAFKRGFRKRDIDPGIDPYKRFAEEKRYLELLARH
jgi:tetratricopeptide (TPR) repeat protein